MSHSFASTLRAYLQQGGTHCLCPKCRYPTLVGRGVDVLEWTCVVCLNSVTAPVLPITKRAVKLCFPHYTRPDVGEVVEALQKHGLDRIGGSEHLAEVMAQTRALKRQRQQELKQQAAARRAEKAAQRAR